MSPVNARRFVVTGFDHDMWRIVVEAATAAGAVRKAAAIYATDGLADADAGFCPVAMDWQVEPLPWGETA
jgi:hypothetical protein